MHARQLFIHARFDIVRVTPGNLLGEPLQVAPGHEVFAATAQNDHADLGIGGRARGRLLECSNHLAVQCVERRRPVHGQDGDRIGNFITDKGHKTSAAGRAWPGKTSWWLQQPATDCFRFPSASR